VTLTDLFFQIFVNLIITAMLQPVTINHCCTTLTAARKHHKKEQHEAAQSNGWNIPV